jgi:hypothetical protein
MALPLRPTLQAARKRYSARLEHGAVDSQQLKPLMR